MATKPCCLIVGAGLRIGQSLALAFVREGYDIALASRNPAKLKSIQTAVEKAGGRARAYHAEAGDDESLRKMIAQVRQDFGDPEVLVYNPATAHIGKPTSLTTDSLIADFRMNVAGALVCTQELVPAMKAKRRGTILLTGGGFAYEPAANYASLSLGKAALRNLTYSLAQELGAHGIHVATVTVYGFVQTDTRFDPAQIAEVFVRLHRQEPGHFKTEYIYK